MTLAVKQPRQRRAENGDGESKRSKQRQCMKRKRLQEKANEEGWKEKKVKEAERFRRMRANFTEKKRAEYREKAKLRMRKLRQEKKTETTAAPVDQDEIDKNNSKVREQWRKAQRKRRSKLSAQKKRRVREKDREYKRAKRAAEKKKSTTENKENSSEEMEESPFKTPEAKRKAYSRLKQMLP